MICSQLQALREEDVAAIADAGDPIRYSPGEVIAVANPTQTAAAFYLVRSGEVLLLPASVVLPNNVSEVDVAQAEQLAVGRLTAGGMYNEMVLSSPAVPLPAHLVARAPGTVVICFELSSITKALGAPGGLLHRGGQQSAQLQQQQQQYYQQQQLYIQRQQMLMQQQQQPQLPGAVPPTIAQLQQQQIATATAGGSSAVPIAGSQESSINLAELEFRRVVGTGQFGLVRVVRHMKTGEVYALKVSCRQKPPWAVTVWGRNANASSS